MRSISACVEAPGRGASGAHERKVYLRVCGGTVSMPKMFDINEGLSPRVRRHPASRLRTSHIRSSISACAEAPGQMGWACCFDGVYLRVCGGTQALRQTFSNLPGLSPRVRRHLADVVSSRDVARSISACAEAPFRIALGNRELRVYLRVCGGT